jgi:hypothetical protein
MFPLTSALSTQLQTSNSTGALQFRSAAAESIAVARSFPGITRDLIGGFHLSLSYLCCYTAGQLDVIGRAMSKIKWSPLQVKFRWMVCAGGSLIVLADPTSQGALATIVSEAEWAMRGANVAPHRFRMEDVPFHAGDSLL